jgi:hypothetical protein
MIGRKKWLLTPCIVATDADIMTGTEIEHRSSPIATGGIA